MYAIVDIETTGGYAANNDITELAIVLHDGQKIVDKYQSLIYTDRPIPRYIQVLTGITPAMLANAPRFSEIAPKVYDLLKNKVFVAHNVNFDHSFLKFNLEACGFDLDVSKLCTVRLSRKVFPGLPSYSLGNLCRELQVPISQRHRAGGDAEATALLFDLLLRNNAQPHIDQFTKKKAKEQSLPPHLSKDQVEQLPYSPGVYYFHDQKGKVVYVGKAKNLRYRVRSHFTHNGTGKQRQDFLRTIHSITYQECGTELMAFILESIEIKRLWPPYNKSQKQFTAQYAIYEFMDQNGFKRLAIDKKRKGQPVLHTFNLLIEGQQLLKTLVKEFDLCPKLCFLQQSDVDCSGIEDGFCKGACCGKEKAIRYNKRVEKAIRYLHSYLPSFAIIDDSGRPGERSCVIMEKGRFYGMGYIPEEKVSEGPSVWKTLLTAYPENEYIRGLVLSFADKQPEKRIPITELN